MTRREVLALLDAEVKRLTAPLARKGVIPTTFAAIRDGIDVAALREAVARGDVEAAMAAIPMNGGMLAPVSTALAAVYATGGQGEVSTVVKATRRLPRGARVVGGFDPGNPVAARWAQDMGSRLVQQITEGTREAVREAIAEGLEAGRNPIATARDIAGRMEGGHRRGGLVGLAENQARAVRNARLDLEQLSSGYFDRARRDRRFDGMVRKAMREGKPLAAADVDRIVGRYADRMLAYRGEMIARTETLTALSAGRDEGIRQMVEAGKINAQAVEWVWDSAGDRRTRQTHIAADGQKRDFDGTFRIGGYPMRYPGDNTMGAPASEIVACRCVAVPKIDYFRGLR